MYEREDLLEFQRKHYLNLNSIAEGNVGEEVSKEIERVQPDRKDSEQPKDVYFEFEEEEGIPEKLEKIVDNKNSKEGEEIKEKSLVGS